MLEERVEVAEDVKAKLAALEAAIDEALICASDLTTSCAHGRKKAGLSAVVGADALMLIGNATQRLHQARSQTVKAHNRLAQVGAQLDLPVNASGGGWKPPSARAGALSLVETGNDSLVA